MRRFFSTYACYIWCGVLGLYLIALAVGALWQVNRLWPGKNSGVTRHFQKENQRQEVLKVTQDTLQKLYQAQDAIARWAALGSSQVSKADQDAINAGVALAAQLGVNTVKTTNVAVTTESTFKPQLLSNYFKIQNTTTRDGVVATMGLFQRSSNVIILQTNSFTSTGMVAASPILPVSGDLRRVTARDLNYSMSRLADAIAKVEKRSAFFDTNKTEKAATVFPADVPPLTPLEKTALQKRLDDLVSSGAARFGSPDVDLIVLMVAFGVLGGVIKCLASMVGYIGSDKFLVRWVPYYIFFPLIGGLMAIAFFLVLRGGIVKNEQVDPANIFAICAVAMLIGMFSDEATKKLAKIAGALFTDNTDHDSMDDATPVLRSAAVLGTPEFLPESVLDPLGLLKIHQLYLTDKPRPVSIDSIESLDELSDYIGLQLPSKGGFQSPTTNADALISLKQQTAEGLNTITKDQLLYKAPVFNQPKSLTVQSLRQNALKSGDKPKPLAPEEMQRLNRLLLVDAYPDKLAGWIIDLKGAGLGPSTVVLLNGKALPEEEKPTVTGDSALRIILKLSNHQPGDATISVVNPDPKGGKSNVLSVSLT